MKALKAIAIVVLAATLFGATAAVADDWGPRRGPGRPYYGPPAYRCAPPRPVYVERHYLYAPPPPVVVERHYYVEPVRYVAPYPSGFFFGMAFADRRSGFSFGFAGR